METFGSGRRASPGVRLIEGYEYWRLSTRAERIMQPAHGPEAEQRFAGDIVANDLDGVLRRRTLLTTASTELSVGPDGAPIER